MTPLQNKNYCHYRYFIMMLTISEHLRFKVCQAWPFMYGLINAEMRGSAIITVVSNYRLRELSKL